MNDYNLTFSTTEVIPTDMQGLKKAGNVVKLQPPTGVQTPPQLQELLFCINSFAFAFSLLLHHFFLSIDIIE
jgi:hypothetical protein